MVVLPYGGSAESRDRLNKFIDQLCAWYVNEDGTTTRRSASSEVILKLQRQHASRQRSGGGRSNTQRKAER